MQLISQDYKEIHNLTVTAFDRYSKQPYYLVPTSSFGKTVKWFCTENDLTALSTSRFGDSELGLMLYDKQLHNIQDVRVHIELIPSLGDDFSYSGLDKVIITEAYDYKLKTVTVSVSFYDMSSKIEVTEDNYPEIYKQAMNFYKTALKLKATGLKLSDVLEQLMTVNKS